jgi:DNA-binding NtrC family response regulator
VVSLKVPPLRKRRNDIALLVHHFLEKFNKETGKKVTIAKVAEEILESYDWPGNVRELQNTVEALVVLCEGHEVTPRDLPGHILGQTEAVSAPAADTGYPDFDSMTLQEMEKWLILRKLGQIKTRSEAAKQLGISRRNLYRRLKEYGVME